jgi:hypothetical protein
MPYVARLFIAPKSLKLSAASCGESLILNETVVRHSLATEFNSAAKF